MTGQKIVDAALLDLGEIAAGHNPTAEESTDGLNKLNRIIRNWNAEALMIPAVSRAEVTLTGAASYNLSTRALKIRSASDIVATDVNWPLNIVDQAGWAAYVDKAGAADFGEVLHYEDGYPLGKVHIAPLVSGTVEIMTKRHIGPGVMSVREIFTADGSPSYTIGIAGTWATERPVEIVGASLLASGSIAKPVDVVTPEKWAAFPNKGAAGKFASVLIYDGGVSTGVIRLAPNPTAGTLELYTIEALTEYATLATEITYPALGYEHALIANLTLLMAPEYGRDPNLFLGPANQAKGAIAALNASVLGPPVPAEGPATAVPEPPAPAQ